MTLDDDVARLLDQKVKRSGVSFKAEVNRVLRLGLMADGKKIAKPFTVKPRHLELPRGMSYDNVAELLETLEGHERR